MKKIKLAAPLLMIAGLALSGSALANAAPPKTHVASMHQMQATQGCALEHASDVCFLNHSGEMAYISIKDFGVEKEQVEPSEDLMDDFYSDDAVDLIHVTIYNANMDVVFDEDIPNHGPILELVAEKGQGKKLAIKRR